MTSSPGKSSSPAPKGLRRWSTRSATTSCCPDGALNRPALAAKAFVDDEQRAKLNGIVHPLVGRRREEIIAAVSEDAVVVEDIPLLVETGMAPMFPLVVVVHADEETRVKRLIKRGMDEADARARIAAQAPEEQRRAIADVLLDNSGSQGELVERARDIWYQRVLPLAHNIRTREVVRFPAELVPYDPSWPDDANRIIARLRMACGHKALRVDHIGSTAVPGMDAKDVIDVQVTVESLQIADELADTLAQVGYPRIEGITSDVPHDGDPSLWRKRIHGAADPGRPANCPFASGRLAQSAVRVAVRGLVDGQPRCARRLPGSQAEGAERAGLCRRQGAVVSRRVLAGKSVGRRDWVAFAASDLRAKKAKRSDF